MCAVVADFFVVYDLPGWKVDLVCVMKAWRCKALANMRKSGLKERAQALSRYIPGSIMVQFTRITWLSLELTLIVDWNQEAENEHTCTIDKWTGFGKCFSKDCCPNYGCDNASVLVS